MNPRAAINDLLPFQGSPFGQLGYFSNCPTRTFPTYRNFCIHLCLAVCPNIRHMYNSFKSAHPPCTQSGESGIRTHAPLRTNGFQDRLVMTTSISLQVRFFINARKIISLIAICVNNKFDIFSKNFSVPKSRCL